MSDKPCLVYVMAKSGPDGMTSPVKIGISSNPDSRLATIQTSCPFKIALAYVFECPNRDVAEHIERCFHETQRAERLSGEWFNYHPITAIHLLCIAFRVALEHNIKDKTLIEPSLDVAGVLWAEKRFNLTTPRQALQ